VFSAVEQRSAEWLSLRQNRLTASDFSGAIGFGFGQRDDGLKSLRELWRKKVFDETSHTDASLRAMSHGSASEPEGRAAYIAATGADVTEVGFAVKGASASAAWLGASPDGLVEASAGCTIAVGRGPGVLEVKCPFRGGEYASATPPGSLAQLHYYMPQVQGQLYILEREWAHVAVWYPSGVGVYLVHRERDYWADVHEARRRRCCLPCALFIRCSGHRSGACARIPAAAAAPRCRCSC
jgi:putative phage-type endonuclease